MDLERKVVDLRLDDILPNRFQPRIKFDENSIFELSESIREHGVIQPIVVRKIGNKYEIIAGERRYKASVMAGKQTIPAIITELNDKDSVEIALIENVQRENLTAIEEAISYRKILDMEMYTQEQLADKLGKNQSTVANKLRLLNLDEEVQEALLENKISERHARSLLKINSPKYQREMLKRIIEERLTVRKTDEEIVKFLKENKDYIKPIIIEEEVEKMNNENVNIPTNPIVEEVVPEVEPNINNYAQPTMIPVEPRMEEPTVFGNDAKVSPINIEVPTNNIEENPTGVNPSFMDVDKIQNQASQIYEQRPVADIDNLLKPDTVPTVEPVMPTIEPVVPAFEEPTQEFIPQGKFFDFINQDEEEKTEEVASEPLMVNSFVNSEVTTPTPSTPVESMVSSVEAPIQQANIFESFNMGVPTVEPAPVLEEVPTVSAYNEAPTQNLDEPVIPNFDLNQPSAPSFENISAETPTPVGSTVENVFANTTNSSFGNNNDFVMPSYVEPTIPQPEPALVTNDLNQPSEQISQTIEQPILSTFTEPVMPVSEPVQNVVDGQMQPLMPTNNKNIRQAIDIIRNSVSQLESLGFIVDSDEIDLENMYQVIIKIDK